MIAKNEPTLMYDPSKYCESFSKIPLSDALNLLKTNKEGLTQSDVKERQITYGLNKLVENKGPSKIVLFFKNFVDILSLLLIFAAFLSWISGANDLVIAIMIIVFANSGFMVYQEWRTEQEMNAIKSWIPEYAKVIRNKTLQKVLVLNLVPGDIIVVEEGDRVPADARLFESHDLYVIEIPLTGEFEPQLKQSQDLINKVDVLLTQNTENLAKTVGETITSPNIIYMSTTIARGTAKAVIFATGMTTRFGQIAHLTQETEQPQSPLEKEIQYFSKYSFALSFIVGGIFFLLGYFFLSLTPINAAIFVVGVMIACVPEGLQATISSALAINVYKLAEKNVLVKRLSMVQTLGSVNLICTDKTGTITKGEMTVRKLWVFNKQIDISGIGYAPKGEFKVEGKRIIKHEHRDIARILAIGALCNTSKLNPPDETHKSWNILGDPTDGALLVAAIKFGINISEINAEEPLYALFTFDSNKKLMTSIHNSQLNPNHLNVYTKGSPGEILDRCNFIRIKNKSVSLTPSHISMIKKVSNDFATEGLRVIGIATRLLPNVLLNNSENLNRDITEKNLIFLGLAAMKDPPRIEVKEAINKAYKAGINVVMITGDNGITAKAIAQEVGIITDENQFHIIKGEDLNKIDRKEISILLGKRGTIFSRVTPDQKLDIVRIARQSSFIVAVTGDGANDAPALHHANVGISMGVSGTDIAKESSDMILTDDSFGSIVNAIEGGRTIWTNLRKFIYFAYTHNWAELIPALLFVLLGTPLPLLAIHILLIDLCIDIVPSLALSRDPPEQGIMEKPPHSINEHLFKGTVFLRSLLIGTIMGVVGFILCWRTWIEGGWILGQGLAIDNPVYLHGITMMYATIVIGQIANLITCRKTDTSVFKLKVQPNPWIIYAVIWQIGILCLTIYIPTLSLVFKTYPLSWLDWISLIFVPIIIIPIQELWRIMSKRRQKKAV
jgi:calcium-translocating P-type ATPase